MHKVSNEKLYREFSFDREIINTESRTVELAFSSEEPVERWFGKEILDHAASSVRLERLLNGGAVLVDHDRKDHVGVVESARIDNDLRGRAVVRFGKSDRANEIFEDIKDGIRSLVSFGYVIHKAVLEEEHKDDPDIYRVMDWEPFEISIVSVPADQTVGVGRSEQTTLNNQSKVEIMTDKTEKTEAEIEAREKHSRSAVEKEQKRAGDILSIAEKYDCRDMAGEFITTGKSVSEFREAVLDKKLEQAEEKHVAPVDLDMGSRELNNYSIVRAMHASVTGDWSNAGLERELSTEIAKQLRRSTDGFFVPTGISMQRAPMVAGTDTAGGYGVATDTMSLIDILRARMMVRRLGATVLSGLEGDLSFPRQDSTNTLSWVGENPGADVTETNATLDQVALTPKTAQATTAVSRQLLAQSSFDVEMFIRNDLASIGALGLDAVAINGGGANEPVGILQTTGIGDVAGGTNGAAPDWADIIALETEVAIDNADVGALSYLTTAKARGKLKSTEKATGTGQFIWTDGAEAGFGMLNGYRAAASTQVPSNLTKGTGTDLSAIIFGNFNDLMIGEWGAMEILVDPYAKKKQGLIEITSIMLADVAVRHPQSFAAMQDAITV